MTISDSKLVALFAQGVKKVIAAAHAARVPVRAMVDGKIVQTPECRQPEKHQKEWVEMAFKCAGCGRYVCGWCEGAADDEPDLCDTCWAEKNT